MKRKGISPLIAAVLLIAFTMAVAAILTAWVTTFTEETTSGIGNESTRLIDCSFAGVSIYDAVYDNSTDQITIAIANTGTQNLPNISVNVFHNDGSVESFWTAGVSTGQVQTTNRDLSSWTVNTASDLDRIRVTPTECPEVTAEYGDITFQ